MDDEPITTVREFLRRVGDPTDEDVDAAERLVEILTDEPEPGAVRMVAAAWERIVAATPHNDPARAYRANVMSYAVHMRFEFTGSIGDLDAAIAAAADAVEADDADRAYYRADLAAILRVRFDRTGNLDDLNAAIDTLWQAVAEVPTGEPERIAWLESIAANLTTRMSMGEVSRADSDLLIEVSGQIVDELAPDDPALGYALARHAANLYTRFGIVGDPADADRAINGLQQAAEVMPADASERPSVLSGLAAFAFAQYRASHDLHVLEVSIAAGRQALETGSDDDPHRAAALVSLLCAALRSRFERMDVLADLDAAIEFGERAVERFAEDDPDWALVLYDLGAAQHTRYERCRAHEDLDAALANLRRAADAAPLGHPSHAMALSSLGLVLCSRFECTGDLADLDAAIEAGQRALDDLPAGALYLGRYQANLDSSLRLRLRHTDPGDAAELADRFASWAAGAVRGVTGDAERGLATVDEMIEFCVGILSLEARASNLSYNRAVALRVLGRGEEAEAGYRAVVDECAIHPDPTVALWAGLALFDMITLVVETSDPNVAAMRVPALVDRLREQVAGSDNPWLGRRRRQAMRIEAELFERVGRTEQVEESRARLRAMLRPAVEPVLGLIERIDPTQAIDDIAPRFAMDWRALVVPFLEVLDERLDMVRELADAPPEDLIELIGRQPELLSMALDQVITAARDGLIPGVVSDADRDRIDRGLAKFGAVFHRLLGQMNQPDSYPVGSGPIETLLDAVDVSISMTDALEMARSAKVVGSLTLLYVNALVEWAMRLAGNGQWRRAARLQLLVLAAAERHPNCEEGRVIVTKARLGWLQIARQVLVTVPDGRVLYSAQDAGKRVLQASKANPEAKPGQHAGVLIALAALYIAPHIGLYTGSSGERLNLAGYRRWLDRRMEYALDPVEVPDEVSVAMPSITETLATGEKYLRRALALAEPAQQGHALKLQLNLRAIRSDLGMDADTEPVPHQVARLVASIDAEAHPEQMLHALAVHAASGGQPEQAAIDRLLSRPIADVAEQDGSEVATSILVSAGHLLRTTDPVRGRRLFADAEDYIRGLTERDRMRVLVVQSALFFDPADLEDGDPDPAANPKDATVALLERAKVAGWAEDRTALAVLALTGRGLLQAANPAAELAWLSNLEVIPQLAARVFAGHADALSLLSATWYGQVSAQAYRRSDWAHAIRTEAAACAECLALSLPDAAMESLTHIARCVAKAKGAGLATVVANALGPLVIRAENVIGAPATEVLQTTWSQVIGAVGAEDEIPALFACLQLAKGARFVDAVRAGVEFDARADQQLTQLLDLIGQPVNEPERDLIFDAITLVTPYTEQLDTGDTSLARQRENLERTFDARMQRNLTGEQAPQLLNSATIRDLLPVDTVLLHTYLSHSPDGGRSLLSLVATKDRLAVVHNQLLDAEHANQRTEVHAAGRVRMLDPLNWTAHRMRQAVLAHPGPIRPVARANEATLAEGLPVLFGPVADLLREEYAAGRRHLVIVPHGGLHFAPLHLLYLDGEPLADTWTVTYLPNLALLDRPGAVRDGEHTLASVGLGFAKGPLPPIPEAVEEAMAVAAEFGTTALLDEQATNEAVFAALSSARLFHIATHGAHNVAAPAFQSLYLADKRVCAHELLRLDLSGLDLITLSGCETALGRFDAADNLRGIPASLLLRGASAIIGTLWPVETHTSRDFFTTLYRELRRGRSRLDAFTEAQRLTRTAHPQYRDWGAFCYTGDWR